MEKFKIIQDLCCTTQLQMSRMEARLARLDGQHPINPNKIIDTEEDFSLLIESLKDLSIKNNLVRKILMLSPFTFEIYFLISLFLD